MTTVGLVLGAGGLVGQAYHAGVLAALEHDLGWDPRTADVIVGSSAGSVTGAALRLGVPARDLAAWATGSALSEEGAAFFDVIGAEPPDLPPFDPQHLLGRWRLPSPSLLGRVARRPWALRPAAAAATLLPAGQVALADFVSVLDDVAGHGWPDGLLVCAARRDHGGRVVFGRPGSPPARLSEAVAASCSIPGYFAPVPIGGVEYLDGGVHSPTSADVLRDHALDLVIVVSPMSASHGRAPTPDAPVRWAFHRRLEREIARLRSAGTEVVRFEPSARVVAAMGINAMADDRAERVVRRAFFDAGRHACSPRVAARLASVAGRPTRRELAVA